MRRPLTDSIQTIGLSSNRLGDVHLGSNARIFSMLGISLDLPCPVLSATPNALSMNGNLRLHDSDRHAHVHKFRSSIR